MKHSLIDEIQIRHHHGTLYLCINACTQAQFVRTLDESEPIREQVPYGDPAVS